LGATPLGMAVRPQPQPPQPQTIQTSKTQHQLHGPDEGVGEDSVAEVADGYVAVAYGIEVAEQVDGDGEFKLHDFAFWSRRLFMSE